MVGGWLAYCLLRLVVLGLSVFSMKRNLRTAAFLGRLLWDHYHRGRKRALDNLRASFPEESEEWVWRTGRRSFEQLAMMAMDMLFTPRLVRKSNWRRYSSYKTVERAKWIMQERKGAVLVTAHYGNFEIIGYLLALFGFEIYSVARPLDNKFINNWLAGVRERHGQKLVDKKGASAMIDDIIGKGSTLAFIADQDAGRKGLFVDFFGRKASTYKSIGLVAMTYELPIIIGCSRRRDNDFFFEIECNRIIMPEEWKGKEDPLMWVTAEYTAAIEEFIRKDPSQYWWLHRRWKHRPKEELQQKEKATV